MAVLLLDNPLATLTAQLSLNSVGLACEE